MEIVDSRFRLGLIVNPIAGLGGPLALKGSDGEAVRVAAKAAGATTKVGERVAAALGMLDASRVHIHTWGGEMGAAHVPARFAKTVAGEPPVQSTAEDTRRAAVTLAPLVDLLLFAGGDGTARDVVDAIGTTVPVLGIPAGVKMQSGVFAIRPADAGRVVQALMAGELVGAEVAEVRDIDEAALRRGVVNSRYYGELLVPRAHRYVQQVKVGGLESEPLARAEAAAWLTEQMVPGVSYFIGAGTTTAAVLETLGIEGTLLGIDIVRDGQLVVADADEKALLRALTGGRALAIVSPTGGQGFVFGRGNQQLSAAVLRGLGGDELRPDIDRVRGVTIVATRSKLARLAGAPLRVDTGDAALDTLWQGVVPVVTGYDDRVLYRIG